MKHIAVFAAILCSLFTVQTASAQTQFWSDNFEDTGAPTSGTRTPSLTFAETTVPYTRYFMRTDLASIAFQNTAYAGIEGSKIWAGEDLDNRGGVNNVVSANQNITWTGINIAGKSGLSFKGLVAANNIGGSVWEGTSFTTAQDYLKVEYSIDGGAWVKGIMFCSDNVLNGVLKVDTDGDLIGDGTVLSLTMAEFTFNIAGTGTSLSVRFDCFTNGTANEEWGIDNFRLFETASCTAPTITSNPPVSRSICAGNNTTFTMAATGATAYKWQVNDGSGFTDVSNTGVYSNATTTTLTITGATAGMNGYLYRGVAVNGVASCFTNSNNSILNISNITSTGTQSNVSCNGGNNGAASVTPSGGIGSYTYSWAPSGGTNSIATGLTANTYTVTITDGISCTATRTFTITQPPAINLSAGGQTNVSCNGGANGTATVSPSGGTPSYTYSWAPSGGTNATASGRPAGSYTVTVTDANSCQATRTFTITQPPALGGGSTVTNVSCFGGSNGAINFTPSGGAGSYTYNWLPSGPTTEDRTGLVAGTYSVQTTDANNCTVTTTMTVTQPAATVSGTSVVTNIACFGGNTGAINYTPTGGTGPYTFNWLPSGPTTEDRTGLTAGTYTVQTTDVNGCTGTVNMTVTQPSAPVSGTSVVTNVSCFGGSNGAVNFTPSGGAGSYTYNWLPSGPTTEDRTGLTAGTYTVQTTDVNGCTGTVNMTVTQPTAPVSGSSVVTNVSCFGGSNGAINFTPSGGTGSYTYNWLPSGPTTEDRTGLTAGTYSVQTTDVNGCTGTSTMTVTQPTAPVSGTSVVTNVSCFGGNNGAINYTPTGGTGPYTYNWLPSGPTTEDRTGLTAGTYTVQTTDVNGCTGTNTMTVTQPSFPVSGTTVVTNVACFGGTTGAVNYTPTGGTGPYTYNWLPSGPTTEDRTGLAADTYSVQTTDVNGCTGTVTMTVTQPAAAVSGTSVVTNVSCFGGSNGAINYTPTGGTGPYTYNWLPSGPTTEDRTGLIAGTYTVQTTDNNGCTGTVNMTVTQPSAPVSGTSVVTNVSCFGGSNGAINYTPTGGTGPYTYNWLPSGPTTEDRTGLVAGTYTVQTTDNNGCTGTVTMTVTQPTAPVSGTSVVTNVSCFGGSNGAINFTPSGGAGSYTYNWLPSGPTTEDRTGLTAGTYTVQTTDVNGCTGTNTITVTQPSFPVSGTTVVTNIACFGGTTGAVNYTPTGGTGPYTYQWLPSGPTTEDRTGLTAGTYTVQTTDANGCVGTVTFTATQPTQLAATTSQTDATCGATDGQAGVSVSGGTPGYTYSWAPSGGNAATATGLAPGTYTVTITDANSCTTTRTFTIVELINFTTTLTSTGTSCNGSADGEATVSITGGTGPFAYSWAPSGGTAATASGLTAGTYTVTITDGPGTCSTTRTVSVTQPTAITGSVLTTSASCNGGTNGSINLIPFGGTSPYTFVWSNGATTEDISGITAGTYTVTVTDDNGCEGILSGIVGQPTAITSSVSITTSLCSGGNDGAVDLSVTGGTPGYTYLWSNTETTQDITDLIDGTYYVTITDANGCILIDTADVVSPVAVTATTTQTNISCFGGTSGAATVNATGGTTPYTYAWSSGAITQGITGRSAGTYTYTVTDDNGCIAQGSVTLTQPVAGLSINTTVTSNVSCFGGNNGSIDASVTGGTLPYTYNWSNGTHNEDLLNATSGVYSLNIVDGNGCQASKNAGTITQPAAPVSVSIDSSFNIACNGAANGRIYTTAGGGTGTLTYTWSNTASTDDVTGLIPGAYSLIVTDANSCSASVSATISQPTALEFDTVINNVNCFNDTTGFIDVNTTGGVQPYTYLWSEGSNTEDLLTIGAGTYSLTVTDANGCVLNTGPIVITQSPAFVGGLDSLINVKCFGANTGGIYLATGGATPPLTYAWSNGALTEDIVNIPAGQYILTITDALGCTLFTPAFPVTQPSAALAVGVDSATNVTCNGAANGEIQSAVSGGTQPYTYLWSNGATSADITGLTPGSYSLIVTDANGCSASMAAVNITQPGALALSSTTQAVNCNGGNSGSIDLSVTGGTVPYTYLWSNTKTSQDIQDLTADTYTITITDANACVITASIIISEPAVLTATAVTTDALCNGATGSVNLTVSGGTMPYGYNWSNGSSAEDPISISAGTYTVTVNDFNGCITTASATVSQPAAFATSAAVIDASCNGAADGEIDLTVSGGTGTYTYLWSNNATTQDITGLIAGTYNVVITDANNCTIGAGAIVGQPAVLTAQISVTDVSCNGGADGELNLTVSGGTSPYTYSWDNNATTEDITGLSADTYNVVVTDDSGCTAGAGAVVGEPAVLSLSHVSTDVSCNGLSDGAVNLTVSGGTSPYTYTWDNNATTDDITGLAAGTYVVSVTDDNGCTAALSATVTQPVVLSATATATDDLCNGAATGGVNVTVTGGTQPYTYLWSNNITTEDLTSVGAGTYNVVITDDNGCTAGAGAVVGEPAAIAVVAVAGNATCNGAANGSVDLTVSGGTAPYTYLWSNGTTNEDATGLAAGVVGYTVTDDNGCTYTGSVTITAPAVIVASEAISSVTCNGDGNGSIDLDVTGGTGPYTFLWSGTTATTEDLAGLSAGTFNVTVTDANSCTASFGLYVVNEPAVLVAGLDSFNNVSCFGESTGDIYVSVTGGTAPYGYLWSNGSTSQDLVNVPAGIYTGTVTDAHGCTFASPSLPITGPAAALTVTFDSLDNVTCNGANDGAIYITAAGGTGPYTYLWNTNATTGDIAGLGAGIYDVTVTDANGCSAVLTGIIITEPAVLAAATSVTDVACQGDVTGAVNVTVTGGTSPYTPVWSSGATTNLAAGTYTVTVTDANACVVTATATINFTNALPIVNLGADTVQCGGTVVLDAGNAGATFAWSDGSTTTQTLTVNADGTYAVTVTANTCSASDAITVTINALPEVIFDITADTLCLNDPAITLSGSPAGGTFSGGIVSNGVLTPNAVGTYPITYAVTDVNGCSASVIDTVVVEVCVGINEVAVATTLSVYPIPNSGSFTIEATGALTCELTNNLGQLIQLIELNAGNNYKYEVTNLGAGMYFVVANNGSSKSSQKVLVVD